jgi:hypothetical protein
VGDVRVTLFKLARAVALALMGASRRAAPFEIEVYRADGVVWVLQARKLGAERRALPAADAEGGGGGGNGVRRGRRRH